MHIPTTASLFLPGPLATTRLCAATDSGNAFYEDGLAEGGPSPFFFSMRSAVHLRMAACANGQPIRNGDDASFRDRCAVLVSPARP